MLISMAAAAAVFVLLLFLCERFFVAGSILVMPLLAASAEFLRLWITAIELNITRCLQQANVYNLATQNPSGHPLDRGPSISSPNIGIEKHGCRSSASN